jgi:isoleucyl-tRNA synthetase
MHVLSVALFDKPAFSNVICHGVVLDAEGKKLSKKLMNYPDPLEVFETVGSDALRWYLMSSPVLRGLDLRIARDGSDMREVARQTLNPIWNAYRVFTLYANADGYQATRRTDSTDLLDRYILAKTHDLVVNTAARLDAYDLSGACDTVQGFLDAFTNWYIRRSRERLWNTTESGAPGAVDTDALDTLYTVLLTVSQVTAPLLPFLAEEIWNGLDGGGSVHLTDWPDPAELPADPDLVAAMDRLRDAASAGLSLRDERNLRIRLPLARAVVAGAGADLIEPFAGLLADELNVKTVEVSDAVEDFGSFRLQPNGRVLGPKLGAEVQTVIKAAKAGEWTANPDGTVQVAGHQLTGDEFDLGLVPLDGVAAAALPGNDTVVVLDTELTPELQAEGKARDLVRLVQQERKERDLEITDRIALRLDLPPELEKDLSPHLGWVAGQVLATDVAVQPTEGPTVKLDGHDIVFDFQVQPTG